MAAKRQAKTIGSITVGKSPTNLTSNGQKHKTNVNKRNYCCIANNIYNILIC